MPEKTRSDGHRKRQPGEGVRDRRKLSWDDYNPAHVESGRLESFPVMGAFASAPAAAYRRFQHSSSPPGTVGAVCLAANNACSNSTGGR